LSTTVLEGVTLLLSLPPIPTWDTFFVHKVHAKDLASQEPASGSVFARFLTPALSRMSPR